MGAFVSVGVDGGEDMEAAKASRRRAASRFSAARVDIVDRDNQLSVGQDT